MSDLVVNIGAKSFPAVDRAPAQQALQDLAFSISHGEFVCITGPSGCGKTTLLNLLAGLDTDYQGEIRLPRVTGRTAPVVGYAFQAPRLLPWRTVQENLQLVADNPRGSDSVDELLQLTGLQDFRHTYPQRLSTGMQRRVALARAFVVSPDLLLMDEPFVSLDEPTAVRLRLLLLEVWQARPTTVIFVTHDLREAIQLGGRILQLTDTPGRIALDVPVNLSSTERADPAVIEHHRLRLLESAQARH